MNNEPTYMNFIHRFRNPIGPKHIDFDNLIKRYGVLYEDVILYEDENSQELVDPEWLSENENKQAFLDAGYDWQYIV